MEKVLILTMISIQPCRRLAKNRARAFRLPLVIASEGLEVSLMLVCCHTVHDLLEKNCPWN